MSKLDFWINAGPNTYCSDIARWLCYIKYQQLWDTHLSTMDMFRLKHISLEWCNHANMVLQSDVHNSKIVEHILTEIERQGYTGVGLYSLDYVSYDERLNHDFVIIRDNEQLYVCQVYYGHPVPRTIKIDATDLYHLFEGLRHENIQQRIKRWREFFHIVDDFSADYYHDQSVIQVEIYH